jgi:mono/diheme cytochrome c family protein
MIKRELIVACAFLMVITSGCKTNQTTTSSNTNGSSSGSPSKPDEFAAVRGIYAKDCESCHRAKGEGGPAKQDDGTTLKVPTLREGRAVRHEDAEYLKQITKGGDGMPAFDQKLTPEQMNQLIRMIRVEFQGK